MSESSVKSAESYRNDENINESGSAVNCVTYRPGVYKLYMVRMTEMSDEPLNVRVYNLTA